MNSDADADVLPEPCSDNPLHYLSYRLTLPHTEIDNVVSIIGKYTETYLIYPHGGDATDVSPHYHILIPTEDKDLSDRIKAVFVRKYNQKGNGFHSSKYNSNGVLCGVSYCLHSTGIAPVYKGGIWPSLLQHAVPFVKRSAVVEDSGSGSTKSSAQRRERLGENVLTLGNLLKQAELYRIRHQMRSYSLRVILNDMATNGWALSSEIRKNGVPESVYEEWEARRLRKERGYCSTRLSCLEPHPRTEKNIAWNGVPCLSRFND